MTWMSANEFRMFTDMAILVYAQQHGWKGLTDDEIDRAFRALENNPPRLIHDNAKYPPPTSLQDYRERRNQSKGGFVS